VDNYALPLIGLLAMLLRPHKNYQMDFPTDIKSALEDVKSALQQKITRITTFKILDVVLGLWTRAWVKGDDGRLTDPTICYIVLSTLRRDGSFQDASQITQIFARFEWDMRAVFAVAIERLVSSTTYSTYEEAASSLEQWYTEKVEGTFNSIRSLQHRASAIAYATQGMPRIWWTDRKTHKSMLYRGHPVHFENIQQVFSNLEQAAVESWESDILMGLNLHVSYAMLADDLTCQDVGYSFLTDPRNTCFHIRDQLCKAILNNPTLKKKFVWGEDEDGLPKWNTIALRTWLHKYAKHHGIMFLRMETIGGAPGRITEMTAMTYCNTKTQQRGLYGFGNYVGVLCRYHKGSAITGKDKLIPHALDAFTADLVIQDLAIARPFAELAIGIVYPGHSQYAKLYRNALWINNTKLFDTPQITQEMQHVTQPVMGFGVGSNDWRHIQIAYSQKLCPRLDELIEEDKLDTIKALQAGHSRATEVRIYGLSRDAIGVAEDILPLYLDASTDWQKVTEVVPGGILLPYKDARSHLFKDLVKRKVIDIPAGHLDLSHNIVMDVVTQLKPAIATTIMEQLQPALMVMIKDSMKTAMQQMGESLPAFTRSNRVVIVLQRSWKNMCFH